LISLPSKLMGNKTDEELDLEIRDEYDTIIADWDNSEEDYEILDFEK